MFKFLPPPTPLVELLGKDWVWPGGGGVSLGLGSEVSETPAIPGVASLAPAYGRGCVFSAVPGAVPLLCSHGR